MNTNMFITDRCELNSLGLVALLRDTRRTGTSPPPQMEEGLMMPMPLYGRVWNPPIRFTP